MLRTYFYAMILIAFSARAEQGLKIENKRKPASNQFECFSISSVESQVSKVVEDICDISKPFSVQNEKKTISREDVTYSLFICCSYKKLNH